MATIIEALNNFVTTHGEEPMAVVMIGENGAERVWLDERIRTQAQVEWAAKHIEASATITRKMEHGGGSA